MSEPKQSKREEFEKMSDKFEYAKEDAKILIAGVLRGLVSLLTPSGWRWIKQTMKAQGFSLPTTIGIVLFSDYRRHISDNKYDSY